MMTAYDPQEMLDDGLTFFHEVLPKNMASSKHSIIVRRYVFRQFRIQITRVDIRDKSAREGHGAIVRELCTYQPLNLAWAVAQLMTTPDPELWCRSIETRRNCDQRGSGRIRLDNTPPGVPPSPPPEAA